MKYITRDDDISVYPFSSRVMNCLRRAGLHTIGALIDYPRESFSQIPKMGKKGIDEIERLLNEIINGNNEYSLLTDPSDVSQKCIEEKKDTRIEELFLSIRAKNCLKSLGLVFASDLLGLSKEELLKTENIDLKTAEEILTMINKLEIEYNSGKGESVPIEFQIAKEMAEYWGYSESTWLREILNYSRDNDDLQTNELVKSIYYIPYVHDNVIQQFLQIIGNSKDGIDPCKLDNFKPDHLKHTDIINQFICEMEQKEMIRIEEGRIYKAYPMLASFISKIPNERSRNIFRWRLEGMTLEEISSKVNITRERVRQVIKGVLSKKPRLHEDQYQYIFENYRFSREDFLNTFGEIELTYNYLELLSSVPYESRKPIEEALQDNIISEKIRSKLDKPVFSDFVIVDGKRLEKTKSVLSAYIIKKYCRTLTSMGDFLNQYYSLLASLGIKEDQDLVIDERTYANKLNASNYVLWNQWRSFRYYNIPSYDYKKLLETLGLENYDNIEISTLKCFRDFPELMKEYDIRDEYELHNLLKKIYPEEGKVTFKRMPTIEIGCADRNKQIMNLLLESWPISNEEFGRLYEERYGVKATTVLAAMQDFNQYNYNGVYHLNSEKLSKKVAEKMRILLSDDFYTIKEIQEIFKEVFPKESVTRINQYTLRKIGFRVYSGYVIKDNFSSAVEYFNWCLTKDDYVDTYKFKKEMTSLETYMSELYRLRRTRKIVEYAPAQYMNIRILTRRGITLDDIDEYCEAAKEFAPEGKYFTLFSLKKAGFKHRLHSLGYEEWFYSSLLAEDKERFSSRKTGRNKILFIGNKEVRVEKLLEEIIKQYDKLSVKDLDEILRKEYNLSYPICKIIELIKGAALYYNSVTGYVYMRL